MIALTTALLAAFLAQAQDNAAEMKWTLAEGDLFALKWTMSEQP